MNWRHWILVAVVLVTIIGLALNGPIPQWLDYHNFADKRGFLGIPNFMDVVSNVPILAVGAFGLWKLRQAWSIYPDRGTAWIPLVLFIGVFTAGFGSMYYHWNPNNDTLVWDRLPMTLMFMALFALIIYDFMGPNLGKTALWLLVPLGIFSIGYWNYTEQIGSGDLRIYAFVQFFPMVAAPLIILLFRKKVPYLKAIFWLLGLYILAKIAEEYDDEIFGTIFIMSGHSIKHVLGAWALFFAAQVVDGWTIELGKADT